jgi:hypothetical protein
MATFPVAPGTVDYAGTYIPEIWSTRLIQKFYDATVFGAIANTDYEGEIKKFGSKVIMRNRPDISITDYVKDETITFQHPEPSTKELDIDHGKKWAFVLDSVDAKQFDVNAVEAWSTDAAEQMKIAIDTELLSVIYALPAAANKGATAGKRSASVNLGVSGTPLAITASTALGIILGAAQVLDEQSAPDTGRWIVLPPLIIQMLKNSDLGKVYVTGDGTSPLRNGKVGMIDRFEVFSSNLITTNTDTYRCFECPFGHKSAITFATQLVENDSMKNPNGFGMLYKGLQVYGYKVVIPEMLGALHVYKGS